MQFQCKLVNNKEQVQECFYRNGASELEVFEALQLFEWKKGTWTITDVAFLDYDENE